jgi:hypothetical protein
LARLEAWERTVMNQKAEKNTYRFAYDEAASELRQILNSFERLHAKKEKIENLIEVLKPEVIVAPQLQEKSETQRKTHLPNCVVITRLTVV